MSSWIRIHPRRSTTSTTVQRSLIRLPPPYEEDFTYVPPVVEELPFTPGRERGEPFTVPRREEEVEYLFTEMADGTFIID